MQKEPTCTSLVAKPSLKLTIFIIYIKLDDFDIADPSSMQDACHINLVNGPAHHESLIAQLVRAPTQGGTRDLKWRRW